MKNKQRNIYIGLSAVTLLAVIGIIIVTILSFNAQKDKDDLNSEIKTQQALLANASAVDLQQKGQEALELEAELAVLAITFPEDLDSTDVMEMALEWADESNVRVLPIRMSPTGSTSILGVEYNLVSFTATIEGTFPDVLNFIDKLENGDTETISVQNVRLSGSGGVWTASLSVNVYSQKAPSGDTT